MHRTALGSDSMGAVVFTTTRAETKTLVAVLEVIPNATSDKLMCHVFISTSG